MIDTIKYLILATQVALVHLWPDRTSHGTSGNPCTLSLTTAVYSGRVISTPAAPDYEFGVDRLDRWQNIALP